MYVLSVLFCAEGFFGGKGKEGKEGKAQASVELAWCPEDLLFCGCFALLFFFFPE